jgi:hypothetical protein
MALGGKESRVKKAFLAGHAKLPQGMAAKSVYEDLALTVEIEPVHHVVLRAACTLVTDLGRDYISEMMVGRCMRDGIEPILADLRKYYFGAAQNALAAALKDLQRCYERWTLEYEQNR